jgi:hypothetical protein
MVCTMCECAFGALRIVAGAVVTVGSAKHGAATAARSPAAT